MKNKLTGAAFAVSCFAVVFFFAAMLASSSAFFDAAKAQQTLLSEGFRAALWLSFWTASLATCLALLFGLPAAYFLSRASFPGKSLVDTLLDIPTLLSPIATGTLLLMLFHTPLGKSLQGYGISFVYTKAGVVLAQFTIIVSLAIRLMKSTFDTIPFRYEHMARLLGCDRWGAFRQVALPLAKHGIVSSIIICWARAFGEFGATVTLAGAMPRQTETIPVGIYLRLGTVDLEGAVVLIAILVAVSTAVLMMVRLLSEKRNHSL